MPVKCFHEDGNVNSPTIQQQITKPNWVSIDPKTDIILSILQIVDFSIFSIPYLTAYKTQLFPKILAQKIALRLICEVESNNTLTNT